MAHKPSSDRGISSVLASAKFEYLHVEADFQILEFPSFSRLVRRRIQTCSGCDYYVYLLLNSVTKPVQRLSSHN